ncbi:MAG: hypothetical protein ACR2FG_06180 [Marmoricola sp.]
MSLKDAVRASVVLRIKGAPDEADGVTARATLAGVRGAVVDSAGVGEGFIEGDDCARVLEAVVEGAVPPEPATNNASGAANPRSRTLNRADRDMCASPVVAFGPHYEQDKTEPRAGVRQAG